MFFSRHLTDFKLLYSIVSHLMIPEAMMIEISTKRFSSFVYLALDTILKYYKALKLKKSNIKGELLLLLEFHQLLFVLKSY